MGARRWRAGCCWQRPAFGGLGSRACRPAAMPGSGERATARCLAGLSPLTLLRLLSGLPSLLRGFLCLFPAFRANRPATRADRAAPGSRIRAHPRVAGTAAQPCTSLSLAPSGRPAVPPSTAAFPPSSTGPRADLLFHKTFLVEKQARPLPLAILRYRGQRLRGLVICGKRSSAACAVLPLDASRTNPTRFVSP